MTDWDKELAKIDKQLASMSDDQLVAPQAAQRVDRRSSTPVACRSWRALCPNLSCSKREQGTGNREQGLRDPGMAALFPDPRGLFPVRTHFPSSTDNVRSSCRDSSAACPAPALSPRHSSRARGAWP